MATTLFGIIHQLIKEMESYITQSKQHRTETVLLKVPVSMVTSLLGRLQVA